MDIVKSAWWLLRTHGPWFNMKMPSYQYREFHCEDETVVRSSYLHNGIPYTGKMTSLNWIRAQGISKQHDDVGRSGHVRGFSVVSQNNHSGALRLTCYFVPLKHIGIYTCYLTIMHIICNWHYIYDDEIFGPMTSRTSDQLSFGPMTLRAIGPIFGLIIDHFWQLTIRTNGTILDQWPLGLPT